MTSIYVYKSIAQALGMALGYIHLKTYRGKRVGRIDMLSKGEAVLAEFLYFQQNKKSIENPKR